jgi:hypothetical protein
LAHAELALDHLLSRLSFLYRLVLQHYQQDFEAAPEKPVHVPVSLEVVHIGDHVSITVVVENGVEQRKD